MPTKKYSKGNIIADLIKGLAVSYVFFQALVLIGGY